MGTKTIEKQLQDLTQQVVLLRSQVIGVIIEKDPEGEYRPAFVKKVLKALKEKPTFVYEGKGSLLRQLKRTK